MRFYYVWPDREKKNKILTNWHLQIFIESFNISMRSKKDGKDHIIFKIKEMNLEWQNRTLKSLKIWIASYLLKVKQRFIHCGRVVQLKYAL